MERKPTPPSQRELSRRLQEPYNVSGPGFQPVGDPNDSAYKPNDRGNQISFKGDTVKPLSLGIQDIDEAVMYYIKNIIKPTVIQNGIKQDVEVVYGSTEKWVTMQKEGYYRDKSGKVMMPIIVFKRNNIDHIRTIGNKLDANFPNNISVTGQKYSPKNAYNSFNVLNRTPYIKQYYATVIPDYVTVTYDFIISTYYVEQMNKIVEAMNYASDSYWGDPEKFKFKAMIDSFITNTELPSDNERIVKSTFSIKLYGYIIPDTIQKDLSSIKKIYNKAQVNFTVNVVSDIPE
jgi:hypothetical protein